MGHLILFSFLIFAVWLIRRDTAQRDGISRALWIPTLWVGILASRPLSLWLGFGGGVDPMEGSPADRLFYLGIILASGYVLSQRSIDWGRVVSRNWPIFLFYVFFLISVLWAESSFVSLKRWFKDFGNIFVALVILTEIKPVQAFRAVFVRCAYVLLPLSVIFIRWFPNFGRRYNIHSGAMEAIGVTFQKNSLGILVLITCLVLIWDWLERTKSGQPRPKRFDRWLCFGLLLIGAYLLNLCDSKTSMLCLMIGALVLLTPRLPLLQNRVGAMGVYIILGALAFYILDYLFDLSGLILNFLGRDSTFTGRTDIWREILALHTDPFIGTGFCSFWTDMSYQTLLPQWMPKSAHNGYLEMYIAGGWIGVFFLILLLLVIGFRLNSELSTGGNYALMRFAVFLTILVGSFSESHFAQMSPLWFMFLLSSVDPFSLPERSIQEEMVEEEDAPGETRFGWSHSY